MDFKEILEHAQKQREINPRYDIDLLADQEGRVRIYFHSSVEYKAYEEGQAVKGSTERFFGTDIFIKVPKERIEKITDGGTIAHLPAVK